MRQKDRLRRKIMNKEKIIVTDWCEIPKLGG